MLEQMPLQSMEVRLDGALKESSGVTQEYCSECLFVLQSSQGRKMFQESKLRLKEQQTQSKRTNIRVLFQSPPMVIMINRVIGG